MSRLYNEECDKDLRKKYRELSNISPQDAGID